MTIQYMVKRVMSRNNVHTETISDYTMAMSTARRWAAEYPEATITVQRREITNWTSIPFDEFIVGSGHG